MPVVDLTVDRNLLCPSFDGYKLSFDAVPVLRQDCSRHPLKLEPHHNQYSLLHVEVFAKHNGLHADPWLRTNCYYVNVGREIVMGSYDTQSGRPREQRVVYTLDAGAQEVGDYNYSLHFISEKYCILCDGMNTFHLLDTGDRSRAPTWQLIAKTLVNPSNDQRGYVLYDARLDVVQERKRISLLAGQVARRESQTSRNDGSVSTVYFMDLTWSHWEQSTTGEWIYKVCEKLETTGSIFYAAFEPKAESLIICSNREIQTKAQREAGGKEDGGQEDSGDTRPQLHNAETDDSATAAPYTWTQTAEDILLRFPLPSNATRNDFDIQSKADHIEVKCLDKQMLLQGELFARVDHDLTTWTVERDELHLTLVKQNAESWTRLLAREETEAEADVDGLPERPLPIPNLEDPIEECDFPLESTNEDIKMVRFNLPTGGITHTIFLGPTPPLFSTSLRPGYPAAFATRQGVDASMWLQMYQPSKPDEWRVRHEGNLHAFAYVQASKEQRKFIDCCPDLDYAVICETHRHVFVYKSRYDSAGGLRKRNGPQVTIGKQSLITLDDNAGEVLGMTTATNVITILTQNGLMYLQV
ncbi:uncharacterized protein Dwil_GK25640 [Drosophila willistoni]|uniref:NudC domain-containing protein 1 n=1 Tax=Drosophila willistoni TaxID=7260 RepID=B4NEG8_DROWI|nr:nudC domain-containing protein 1 [Drosophila willistoni]EDW82137.1 uncharacterized protein Dwil_GK25640 [Drosophila willistoni]